MSHKKIIQISHFRARTRRLHAFLNDESWVFALARSNVLNIMIFFFTVVNNRKRVHDYERVMSNDRFLISISASNLEFFITFFCLSFLFSLTTNIIIQARVYDTIVIENYEEPERPSPIAELRRYYPKWSEQ